MARCKNEALLAKIGINKIAQTQEVSFTVLSDLPDCKKINAKAYMYAHDTESEDVVVNYDNLARPNNQFECMRQGCVNSGTLYTNGAEVAYHALFDGTEFAQGIITFYVKDATGDVTVKIASDAEFANADQYVVTPGAVGADGYAPVIVDLSKVPTAIGDGWTPSANGAYISIKAEGEGVGISSIAIFDEIADFEVNDVVKIACLSDISATIDIDALETTCWASGYDAESFEGIDYTVTGKALTPNYDKLNPLIGKGTRTEGFENASVSKVVEAEGDYGKVTIPDMSQEECGFVGASLADSCDVTDAMLVRLSIPTLTDIDAQHFLVLPNSDGSTDIYFDRALVGKEVVIAYPKRVEIEELVADKANIGTKRVRMSYEVTQTDGVKYVYVFDNVLVTSFPMGITNEETEFEFSFRIQPDMNGVPFRKYRILA